MTASSEGDPTSATGGTPAAGDPVGAAADPAGPAQEAASHARSAPQAPLARPAVVRSLSDDRVDIGWSNLAGDLSRDREVQIVCGVTALVALVVSWRVVSGGLLSLLTWLVAGLATGLVVAARGSARQVTPSPGAWLADPLRFPSLAGGAAASFVLAALTGRSLPLAVALAGMLAVLPLGALPRLTTGWLIRVGQAVRAPWPTRLTSAQAGLVGVAMGGLISLIVPRWTTVLLAIVAAGAVVALLRTAPSTSRPGDEGPPPDGADDADTAVGAARLSAIVTVTLAAAAAASALLAGSLPADAKPVDAKHVKVQADRESTTTGITVAAGEMITVKASGTVHFLGDDKRAVADIDGYPARYSGCGGPGFCGALVGRVGPKGAWFPLRSTASASAPAARELELGINDFNLDDNTGSFDVVVTVSAPTAQPGFSTTATTVAPVGSSREGTGGSDGGGSSHSFVLAIFAALFAAVGALIGHRAGRELMGLPSTAETSAGERFVRLSLED